MQITPMMLEQFLRNPTEFRDIYINKTQPMDYPSADVVINNYVAGQLTGNSGDFAVLGYPDRKTKAAREHVQQIWESGKSPILDHEAQSGNKYVAIIEQYLSDANIRLTGSNCATKEIDGLTLKSDGHLTNGTDIVYPIVVPDITAFQTYIWQTRLDRRGAMASYILENDNPIHYVVIDRQDVPRCAWFTLPKDSVALAKAELATILYQLRSQMQGEFARHAMQPITLERPHWLPVTSAVVQNNTLLWSK